MKKATLGFALTLAVAVLLGDTVVLAQLCAETDARLDELAAVVQGLESDVHILNEGAAALRSHDAAASQDCEDASPGQPGADLVAAAAAELWTTGGDPFYGDPPTEG